MSKSQNSYEDFLTERSAALQLERSRIQETKERQGRSDAGWEASARWVHPSSHNCANIVIKSLEKLYKPGVSLFGMGSNQEHIARAAKLKKELTMVSEMKISQIERALLVDDILGDPQFAAKAVGGYNNALGTIRGYFKKDYGKDVELGLELIEASLGSSSMTQLQEEIRKDPEKWVPFKDERPAYDWKKECAQFSGDISGLLSTLHQSVSNAVKKIDPSEKQLDLLRTDVMFNRRIQQLDWSIDKYWSGYIRKNIPDEPSSSPSLS